MTTTATTTSRKTIASILTGIDDNEYVNALIRELTRRIAKSPHVAVGETGNSLVIGDSVTNRVYVTHSWDGVHVRPAHRETKTFAVRLTFDELHALAVYVLDNIAPRRAASDRTPATDTAPGGGERTHDVITLPEGDWHAVSAGLDVVAQRTSVLESIGGYRPTSARITTLARGRHVAWDWRKVFAYTACAHCADTGERDVRDPVTGYDAVYCDCAAGRAKRAAMAPTDDLPF